jgi:hypothetical protein
MKGEIKKIIKLPMNPKKKQELDQHLQAIAEILYEEAESDKLETLGGIEETIREQTLEYITPQLGFFLSRKKQELRQEESEK